MFRFVNRLMLGVLCPIFMPLMANAQSEYTLPNEATASHLRMLIDAPTAGGLARGNFAVDLRVFEEGGLLAGLEVGATPRLSLGLVFGGQNVIGSGAIDWNPRLEITLKYHLISESYPLPAVAIGFNSQGYGTYDEALKRYRFKSKGFYLVGSKNYLFFLGTIGFHGGVNYSLENEDKQGHTSVFMGVDKSINPELFAIAEYDLALNDNNDTSRFGRGRGYFNLGIQWIVGGRLHLQFYLRNLFNNLGNENLGWGSRELKIGYVEYF